MARSKRPLHFLSVVVILFALILLTKLYFVQIIHGKTYRDQAEHQYVSPGQNIFDRGTIYFTNKDGSLYTAATLQSGYTLVIDPGKIQASTTSLVSVYASINKIVPVDQTLFMTKVSRLNDHYEELGKHIAEPDAKRLTALKITGLTLVKDRWRLYPGSSLASQTIGLLGYKGDTIAGRYGLERSYQDTLKRSGSTAYVNFFAELFSDISKTVSNDKSREGDIVTTIEPTVQAFLEKQIADTKKLWSSDEIGGIVMDPHTGEIVAMSTLPDFNLNHFQETKDAAVFSNPIVEHVHEMGSIIKPLTMAAGLDAGVVTASTTYNDLGFLVLNGKRIANYDGKGRGVVNMQEVLSQSLNTGAAFVTTKLGNQRFSEYFYNFGVAEKTGIDLPNEAIGLADNLQSPRDIEHATASYGQGLAMTPIATARALAALANDGVLPFPHVVKQINYQVGLSETISLPQGRRVISSAASQEISRMLVTVVDKALLKGTVKLDHYSVAAKTGTAEIPKPGGGYYLDRYLHSFFGYFPAYHPKYIIFLYHIYPKGAQYASVTLTEPFINLTKFLINYYVIPPDR